MNPFFALGMIRRSKTEPKTASDASRRRTSRLAWIVAAALLIVVAAIVAMEMWTHLPAK